MHWKEIELSATRDYFQIKGKRISQKYLEAQKFHAPGLAPVRDRSGWYHINIENKPLYGARYDRLFGFYFGRAVAVKKEEWFHLDTAGKRVYAEAFSWCGNYQEAVCTVRKGNDFFHINSIGERLYRETYTYAGDFRDGIACVRTPNGLFRHIDLSGTPLNQHQFRGLGVFHKGIATAQDEKGWFHIDHSGEELYLARFLYLEPFYNGFALAEDLYGNKGLLSQDGNFSAFEK